MDNQSRPGARLSDTEAPYTEGMAIASAPAPFSLRTTVRDGLAVVAVVGELDCATAPELGRVLDGLDPGRVVLVDLSETEFMDCAGVGVLADSYRRQCQLGGELFLDAPRRAVSRVLQWTQLDRMITVLHHPQGSSLLDGCSPSPRTAEASTRGFTQK